MASLWSMSQLENAGLGDAQAMVLLNVITKSVVDKHRTRIALETVGSIFDLARVVGRNGTAQATTEVRTSEWFEEHGK